MNIGFVRCRVLFGWVLLVVLFGSASIAAEPPAANRDPLLSEYQLGSGDRIRLIVYGEPDLTGEYTINGAGQLAVPLIGTVKAGGMSVAELEQIIADKLTPDYIRNPSVTVEVTTYRPFYIVGEVNKPGSYPFVNGMTVMNAVAVAGGFTYRADEDDFYVERGGNKQQRIEGDPRTEVFPGDVIIVRERFF